MRPRRRAVLATGTWKGQVVGLDELQDQDTALDVVLMLRHGRRELKGGADGPALTC